MAQVLVCVGTIKGAFFFTSDESRTQWKMTGPHLPGWEVSAICIEPRAGGRIYLGTTHFVYGATIRVSDDQGATWQELPDRPHYSPESGFKTKRIWQLANHPTDNNTLYAGLDEAGIFVSRDRGQSWNEFTSLTNQPSRQHWHPGNGGLCLHTIVTDPENPNRIWVGISAVGVFRTTDGGQSWMLCNKGLPVFESGNQAMPDICCVHKIVADPKGADTLYMQFHGGVLKSTDGADSWQTIESGLPGNFGFPMAISSRGEIFVAPLANQEMRVMKDGDLSIYRSRDAGASWQAMSNGLPRDPQYVGVLRDAMTCDTLDSAGVYFGTSTGDVYFSTNAGERWGKLPGNFPRIETIKAAVL